MGVGWNQKFAFERSELSRVHRFLAQEPGLTIQQYKQELPYGSNKVEGYINYLSHYGIYDKTNGSLTAVGKLIAQYDPGWRHLGTQLLLQFEVANQPDASVWYHMTNTVLPRFSRLDEEIALAELLRIEDIRKGSMENTKSDLRYYFRSLTEQEALGDLNLLRMSTSNGKTIYKRSIPDEIPPMILAFILYRQRASHFPNGKSIALPRLLEQPGGVGRAFNLYIQPEVIFELIRPLRQKDIVSYTQTAQLNDVEFLADVADPIEFAAVYYQSL
ncbi:MAG: DUF4007 family protein [Chloroflexi bacterium]|nr:MAG: DUF4007 family protein [Chloroflexota bacterium]